MTDIHQEITFNASAAAVYKALTDSTEFAKFTRAEARIDATPVKPCRPRRVDQQRALAAPPHRVAVVAERVVGSLLQPRGFPMFANDGAHDRCAL